MKKLFVTLLVFQFTSILHAQNTSAGIRIISESKEIFKEDEMIKQVMDNVYYAKMDRLKEKTVTMIKAKSKDLTDETPREEVVAPSLVTEITVEENAGKTFIQYIILRNNFQFNVTTPDVIAGIGASKTFDPQIYVSYNVKANFELIQSGTAESIKFINPKIQIYDMKYFVTNSNRLNADKDQIRWWVDYNIQYGLQPIYLELNDISTSLNEYVSNTVKKNPLLLKEFEIDENKQLVAKPDAGNTNLVFHHSFSSKGIVNRNVKTKPADASQTVRAVPASKTHSTSAAGIGKPSAVSSGLNKSKVTIKKN